MSKQKVGRLYERVEMTDHHRRPESLGGKFTPENISRVPAGKHRAWHTLFKSHTPQVIADIINKIWLDPDWEFVVVPRKKKIRR